MNRLAPFACLVAAALAGPALAQSNADKARLDDFATPSAEAGVDVAQISASHGSLDSEQTVDRTIAAPVRTKGAGNPAADQVSRTGDGGPVGQLAPVGDRNPQSAPALSKREDGRPTGAVSLGGRDRCDPQASTADETEACKRVIETRAREFNATEAPRLSPEQELLAHDDLLSRNTLAEMAASGRANRSPNADERAAQELGFVTLSPSPSPSQPDKPEDDAPNATLSEAIKGVLVNMGIPQP